MSGCKDHGVITVEFDGNIGSPVGCYQCEIDRLRAEVERQQETIRLQHESIIRHQRMHAPIPPRALLYTDSIGGQQICRDDMWAVTTEELNRLTAEVGRWVEINTRSETRLAEAIVERDAALAKLEAVREYMDNATGPMDWNRVRAILDGEGGK